MNGKNQELLSNFLLEAKVNTYLPQHHSLFHTRLALYRHFKINDELTKSECFASFMLDSGYIAIQVDLILNMQLTNQISSMRINCLYVNA